MRVALLQLGIDSRSRAANLSRALRMVDEACSADPSPDLVVLPEACDTGQSEEPTSSITPAMADGFGQSLASKAREWGVYVAAGFHQVVDGAPIGSAALYDPDGDVVVRCCRGASPCAGATRTSFGVWAVGLGSDRWDEEVVAGGLADAGVRLVVVPALQTDAGRRCLASRGGDLSKALKAYTCVAVGVSAGHAVDAAGGGPTVGSRVWGCDGAPLAHRSVSASGIVSAEIPLEAG
ncbi:MAG: carbon-nitrogen hydrolase family protein [Phycisphaerales bacterium]|nr:MAG: carbon-nitrogen hydrolase family protein [Phycisphaerales bacterium]